MSTNELTIQPATQANLTFAMTPATAMLFDQAMAARAWKAASLYASSDLVPSQFRNRPENVFIMMQLAVRTGQDLFMMLQNCYIVHGRPGFEAKYLIGQLHTSGKVKGTVRFEFSGEKGTDDYGCTAWVIDRETSERIDGPKVDWRMVKGEGWDKPKGGRDGKPAQKSKWETMSDLMFRYRAAAMLIRTTYPDVTMGLQTREELEDSIIDVTTQGETAAQRNAAVSAFLSDDLTGSKKETVPLTEEEKALPSNPPTAAEVAAVEAGEPVNQPAEPEKPQSTKPQEPTDDEIIEGWKYTLEAAETSEACSELRRNDLTKVPARLQSKVREMIRDRQSQLEK